MDREGDNYDLFSKLIDSDARYIIRLAHNRNLVGETDKLKEVVSRTSTLYAQVQLAVGVPTRGPRLSTCPSKACLKKVVPGENEPARDFRSSIVGGS
jgi:hypothetical protein